MTPLPPLDYLKECLRYCPKTGALYWRSRPVQHFPANGRYSSEREQRRWNCRYAGTVAGISDPRGYLRVKVNRHRYKAHRLIWKMMTGNDPQDTIDHIDGVPNNNVWTNLRVATQQQQVFNSCVKKNNSTGHSGVDRRGKKFRAYITFEGVRHELGRFNSIEDAITARAAAARRLHGDFYRSQG